MLYALLGLEWRLFWTINYRLFPWPFDFYALGMILKVGHSDMRKFFYRCVLSCSARENSNRNSNKGCENSHQNSQNICLRNVCWTTLFLSNSGDVCVYLASGYHWSSMFWLFYRQTYVNGWQLCSLYFC